MIPRPRFSVLWGEDGISILWICFSASRLTDCCLLWHAIIKPHERIVVTCFTPPAQLFIDFSITKGDKFVRGMISSLLFRTINLENRSLTPISTVMTFSIFLLFFGFDQVGHKSEAMLPCITVDHPCPPPTTECQYGRYLNSEDLRQKISGIPRMVYSNRRISLWTQVSYQGWFPDETTVWNTNYSIDQLDTAFFNDPFQLFGAKTL